MHSRSRNSALRRARQVGWTLLCAAFAAHGADELAPAAGAPTAPSCSLEVAGDQSPVDFSQYRGQVLYVDFWASWCGPCRQSFPFMNELQSTLGDKGLTVLAVNLDEEPNDAQQFLSTHPASFKVIGGANQPCATAFAVQAMPSSYLVDRAGRVRYVHHGFRAGDAELLHALAETLLAEPPSAP